MLHTALEQARKWKLIAHNPAADATPPSVPHKKARGYTEDEIARMLKAAEDDPEGYCVLALLLTTGIRRSELLGLGLDTVDLDQATLDIRRTVTQVKNKAVVREVAKTKSSYRTLGIPAAVVLLLRAQKARVLESALAWGSEYSREPMFLFPGMAGVPMLPMSLTLRLRQFRRRAKIPANVQPVHGWRHAAATMLIATGTDVKTTQSRLGHSTAGDHAAALRRQGERTGPRRRRGTGRVSAAAKQAVNVRFRVRFVSGRQKGKDENTRECQAS